jgi:Domain of unknown function (DUF4350)
MRDRGSLAQAFALIGVLLGSLALVNRVVGSTVPNAGSATTDGSSFETAPRGAAAFATLLERSGQQVSRRRIDLGAGQRLNPETTLIVFDGELDRRRPEGDVTAVQNFLAQGGRLVTDSAGLVSTLSSETFAGDVNVPERSTAQPPPDNIVRIGSIDPAQVGNAVRLPAGGPLLDTATLPPGSGVVFGASVGVLVADVSPLTGGSIVLLANTYFLSNAGLATEDSAAYALSIARNRPVVFAEAQHGYGESSGLGGLPARWRWSLVFVVIATLAAMWSKGRRNGPPEPAHRELPPPRRRTIDMVAASIVRSWKANGGTPTGPPGQAVPPGQTVPEHRTSSAADREGVTS